MNSKEPAPHRTSLALKWPEVYSLAALSAAVAISWIAYHEYQPHLLEKFDFRDLAIFLIVTKGIVLVIIPPFAGWLSDIMIKRTGRFFMIFSVGIGITAMVFMVVASIIGMGPASQIRAALPFMIVLWLIAMNLFTSPALSMIDSFAPTQKLPLVVGFLVFVTQLIYALEPVVIQLVQFFGDTLTFIVGGLLIACTGYLFQRVSFNEVTDRRHQIGKQQENQSSPSDIFMIIIVGFVLGIGNAFLVEFVPIKANNILATSPNFGGLLSFTLLGIAALIALLASGFVAKKGFTKVLFPSLFILVIAVIVLFFSQNSILFIGSGLLLAVAFAVANISALPYAISRLSAQNITFGVGMFIGASYIVEGILEYMYR